MNKKSKLKKLVLTVISVNLCSMQVLAAKEPKPSDVPGVSGAIDLFNSLYAAVIALDAVVTITVCGAIFLAYKINGSNPSETSSMKKKIYAVLSTAVGVVILSTAINWFLAFFS